LPICAKGIAKLRPLEKQGQAKGIVKLLMQRIELIELIEFIEILLT